MKFCATCETVKPVAEFGKKRQYVTEFCKECRGVKLRSNDYGLSMTQVRAMLSRETCECCDKPFASNRQKFIDHDHRSGAVRGLLCQPCNTALGCVNDDPEHLRRLITYIADRS